MSDKSFYPLTYCSCIHIVFQLAIKIFNSHKSRQFHSISVSVNYHSTVFISSKFIYFSGIHPTPNRMAEVVEGEWKDFVFKMVQDEHVPSILEHLRIFFYRDENLCKHLGYDDETAEDFDNCAKDAMTHNLSFVCVQKGTNKIAGVRLTVIAKKNDHSSPPSFKSPKASIIINFLAKGTEAANIFGAYPDIEEYADFFMASVDPEFRGLGIASEMYVRSLKLFKAKGIKVCKSVLTSPFTRKACANLGFTEHSKLYLKDYKDPEGNLFFPNAGADECITVKAKRV